MKEDVEKGLYHLFKFTNVRQRDLLHYYFGDGTMGLLRMNKDELKDKLQAYYEKINDNIYYIH